jgi:hypothetical protein
LVKAGASGRRDRLKEKFLMVSFWNLLPASLVGQPQTSGWPYADPLDPYSQLLPIRQDAGSKAAVPSSAGASAMAAPTQKPLTFWDLLPATPHGQPFVPMMPSTRQPDPWVTPAIRATSVTPSAQLSPSDADRSTSNSGILGPVLGQSASGGDQASAMRQLAAGQAQAMQPAAASDLRTRLLAMGATAIRPITSYLPTQRQYALEGADQVRQGWRDFMGQTLSDHPSEDDLMDAANRGLFHMALGAANWLGSPINAGIHTLIGQPAEDAIGIPSTYTDFAAGLALPFVKGLRGVGTTLAEPARVPRSSSAALADTATAQRAPRRATDSPVGPAPPPTLAGASQYTREEADLIRNWLGIDPQRFRGTVRLDPPTLEGRLLDQNGALMGRITRSISHKTGAAYHDFFDLEEPYQKLGISKAINRASIDYYRKLGLSRVDLEATLDRGGYTWARYGFLPTQESWDALRLVLRVKLDDPTLNIAADDQQAMLNLLESRDPHTIWDIADYRVPVVRKGETLPIGNHLLSNTDWEGSLDLNDAASMNRFDHYVRPEK